MTSEAYAELGKMGGEKRAINLSRQARKAIAAKGGKARADKLTAEQRSEVARKAWVYSAKAQAAGV
jgi:general stress protein YciG